MKPIYFSSPGKFRTWLEKHFDKRTEQWVGYYKKATGRKSMTWPESVDQALCFGWIDGIRKRVDEERYVIRFTPRRPVSNWSDVNIKRIAELIEQGLVHQSGLDAFGRRKAKTSLRYAYEQGKVTLSKDYERRIRANPDAWRYFQTLAPSYKKPSIWWVMSAKSEQTRLRRLDILIKCSAKSERIPNLVNSRRPKKKK